MNDELKQILIDNGWTPYSFYGLQSPDYGINVRKLIADWGYQDGINIYVDRSRVAQDGKFICKIETKDQLNKFLEFLKSL